MSLKIRRVIAHADDAQNSPEGGSLKTWGAVVVSVTGGGAGEADLEECADLGEQIGQLLGTRLLRLHAFSHPDGLLAYGKAAIVGAGLSTELGAAILHPKLGKSLRKAIGGGRAIMPSTMKLGAPGASIDIPLHGVSDEWDFSLLDSIEATVPNAPAPHEIVVLVALARGGRPDARIRSAS